MSKIVVLCVAGDLRKAGKMMLRGVSFATVAQMAEPLSNGIYDK